MFTNFYHGSFKRTLTAFTTMFDNIEITLDNKKTITVPLHYAQREKFMEVVEKIGDKTAPIKNVTMPIMGFEMTAFNPAPERAKNQLHKITNLNNDKEFMYNRVPWDVTFELYIATKKLDDSFKIVEQILPTFSPGLTVKVKDFPKFSGESNMVFDLTSASMNIQYEDDFSDVRHILWNISFTVKTYLYRDIKQSERIQNVLINVSEMNDEKDPLAKFLTFMENNKIVTKVDENE